MESTYSADSVTEMMLNVTEPVVKVTSSGGRCVEGLALFRLVCEVYLATPIAVLGIFGNILAFIVLCNHKQKLTTTVILQALAVADTLILATVIPLKSLWISSLCLDFPHDYKETWKLLFRGLFPLLFVLRMIDTWLITLLTMDRWIAVCRPLHAPRLCTRRSTYMRLCILVLAACVFSLPRLFEHTQYGVFDTHHDVTVLNNYRWYSIGYKIILFFVFMYLVPMTLLIVLNVQLILALRVARSGFSGRRHSQSSAITAQHRGITVIVITVVTTCVVCNLLAMVGHTFYTIQFFDRDLYTSLGDAPGFVSQVSGVMIVINSSINFLLYTFSSKNFRQVTMKTFGCEKVCQPRYSSVPRSNNESKMSETASYYISSQKQSNGNSKGNEIQLQKLIKASQ